MLARTNQRVAAPRGTTARCATTRAPAHNDDTTAAANTTHTHRARNMTLRARPPQDRPPRAQPGRLHTTMSQRAAPASRCTTPVWHSHMCDAPGSPKLVPRLWPRHGTTITDTAADTAGSGDPSPRQPRLVARTKWCPTPPLMREGPHVHRAHLWESWARTLVVRWRLGAARVHVGAAGPVRPVHGHNICAACSSVRRPLSRAAVGAGMRDV